MTIDSSELGAKPHLVVCVDSLVQPHQLCCSLVIVACMVPLLV